MAPLHPTELINLRSNALKHYEVRAKHLSDMEKALHSSMPRHVEGVVKDKRILLFKEMLRDIDHDDQEVVNLLINGVKVVGCLEGLSIWPRADNSPACTVADVVAFESRPGQACWTHRERRHSA